jgi:hypothetical protein
VKDDSSVYHREIPRILGEIKTFKENVIFYNIGKSVECDTDGSKSNEDETYLI